MIKTGKLFFILLFSVLAGYIHAQNTGTLYGKISNTNGEPIEFANIKVAGHPEFHTAADSSGNYSIIIPSDSNVVLVFSQGKSVEYREVNIKKGVRKKMDFAVSLGKELIVVDYFEQGDRTVFMDRIPVKDVFVQTGPTMDFNLVLMTLPGVSSNNDLSSGYSVRGGNFDENLVYVNDIEIYRPFLVRSGQQEGLSFVNPDMVQEINFSNGGFEARYGDKMSSVLDIKYKRPGDFKGSVSGSLLGGTASLEGRSKNNRFTWLVGARQKSNSYLLKTLDTKGDYKPSFYDVQSYCTYNFTDRWQLDVLASISGNKYSLVPLSRQSDFGTVNEALRLSVYFEGQELDEYKTYLGGLTLINKRGKKKDLILKYIASAYQANESETYDILGNYSLDELETDFGKSTFGQVKFNIGVGGFLEHARNYLDANVYNFEHKGEKIIPRDSTHKVEQTYYWGIKAQHEIINDHIGEWKMVDSSGYSIPQGNPNTIDLQDVVKSKIALNSDRFSGYVQGAWGKIKRDTSEIKLTTGMRANYWDLNKQFLAGPRATLSYKPHWRKKKSHELIDVVFKAASGYYYQPPFYREMRDMYGRVNTNIKAQTSIHYVIGSDLNFKAWGRDFKFLSEIYYKQLKNLIPYEIDNVRIRYYATNNSNGYATGIDMKIAGEFVNGVDSWISMSVMQTRENLTDDAYVLNYNRKGELIIPGYTTDDTITSSVTKHPGYIPRPTDQRVNFGLFFQDHLPKFERAKMHMNILFGSGLPFGPPSYDRYKDTLRMPPYRRVDIGFSFDLMNDSTKWDKNKKFFKGFHSMWLSMEVYNLLAVNNTISYLWIKDVTDRQYAIPNYLSRRLINVRLVTRF